VKFVRVGREQEHALVIDRIPQLQGCAAHPAPARTARGRTAITSVLFGHNRCSTSFRPKHRQTWRRRVGVVLVRAAGTPHPMGCLLPVVVGPALPWNEELVLLRERSGFRVWPASRRNRLGQLVGRCWSENRSVNFVVECARLPVGRRPPCAEVVLVSICPRDESGMSNTARMKQPCQVSH
jgi:hypothetical protein